MPSVLLLGDSHLAEGSREGVVKLGARLAARGWTVEYRAQGGLTTRDALERFRDLPEAELAICCFGSNDAAPWKQVPLDEFVANLRQLLGRCQAARILVLGPPPVASDSTAPDQRTNGVLHRYSEAARVVAEEVGATFTSLIALIPNDGTQHRRDRVHLNNHAYAVLEELVVATAT